MNLEIKDVVTLDDNNKYVIASIANFEDKRYYYLVDINNNSNLMFCYKDNGDLVESVDKELNTKLLPLFYEASKDIIKEFINNNNN